MQLFDNVALGDARVTADGYLVADVRAARTGIQIYAGSELGKPGVDQIRVYRPAEEVFKDAAMASFTSMPVTVDHPPEMVSAKNWKKYAVGFTGETCAKDGGFIRVPLALKDAAAISAVVQDGKRQLSCGYTCDVDFTAGVTPEGEPYDAVQKNLRGNHLAIVSAGRAGPECRVGDKADDQPHGGHEMADNNLKTVAVDGIPILVTDQGATVIDTLKNRLATTTADNLKLIADHNAALASKDQTIADKDKELGTKDAEIARLKGEVLDAAKLDALVAARADVLGKAKAIIADVDVAGKSLPEIRRATVVKKLGDAAVKDKSDDYVEALFDQLAKDAKPTDGRDPVRDALGAGRPTGPANDAHAAMVSHLQDSWKTTNQKGAA